jgi:XTP/dITP diphosphohydrolase
MQSNTVVIATKNLGKVKEFTSLLQPLGYDVKSLADFEAQPDIEEDGDSFFANALKKAQTTALRLECPVIADDSGLCVDALNGMPGVRSARYAGEAATDLENNLKLITELRQQVNYNTELDALDLQGAAPLSRARFVCALVLYHPQTEQVTHVEGTCEGIIISDPRGEGGFGYDPLFYLPQFAKTMAELSPEEKNKISHRGAAMRKLLDSLQS